MTIDPKSLKTKALFGLSAIPDQLTYQAFSFLIFTYYFAVVGLDMISMWIAYVIWGAWNALNDPLLGALSDRTRAKWGRKIYLIVSIIPLSLMMIFLFTAPMADQLIKFLYFLFVILLFEGVYTLFDVNVNAVFPEMFDEKERVTANVFVKGFTVLALIFSFLLPTIVIPQLVISQDYLFEQLLTGLAISRDLTTAVQFMLIRYVLENSNIMVNYVFNGIILAAITGIFAVPFLMFGIKEPEEGIEIHEQRPGFVESLKITLGNKTFVKFVIANTAIWYIFGILPTILPLYSVYVLGIDKDSILIGVSLLMAFLIAGFMFPVHRKIGRKIGMRNGLILTCIVWLCTMSLYVFLYSDPTIRMLSILVTGIQGFGLAGAMYYVDLLIGDVIDEDELKTGVRRSGSYYGINAFIHRFSTILIISSIALVFSGTGWSEYTPASTDPLLVTLGLKALIFVFPAVALLIAIFFLKRYELHGDKLEEMRKKLYEKRKSSP
ncbi:MAG: MFS transporter [Candidatus Helarchaeota archaeon]